MTLRPQVCPMCNGGQVVRRGVYEPACAVDDLVPCRSCDKGVVWPPTRVAGDLIVEGNVIATGYREWVDPSQVDCVTGKVRVSLGGYTEAYLLARISEVDHPTRGHIHIRECMGCREPYPEWSVSSRMRCPECQVRGARSDRV